MEKNDFNNLKIIIQKRVRNPDDVHIFEDITALDECFNCATSEINLQTPNEVILKIRDLYKIIQKYDLFENGVFFRAIINAYENFEKKYQMEVFDNKEDLDARADTLLKQGSLNFESLEKRSFENPEIADHILIYEK